MGDQWSISEASGHLDDLFDLWAKRQHYMTIHHIRKHYLSSFDLINPAGNLSLGKDQRILFQELNIFLDTLLQLIQLQEVKLINHIQGRVRWIGVFDNFAQLFSIEGKHATPSMVEDGNFASPEETLGNDNATKGVSTITQGK